MTSHAKPLSHKIIMSVFELVMEPSIFMGKMLAIVKSNLCLYFTFLKVNLMKAIIYKVQISSLVMTCDK